MRGFAFDREFASRRGGFERQGLGLGLGLGLGWGCWGGVHHHDELVCGDRRLCLYLCPCVIIIWLL